MKRINYLPIAILAIAPVTAFAHKVPYGASHCAMDDEQAEYEQIPLCTEEEKEKASATAYCKFMGHPDFQKCAQSLVSHGMAEAAGRCAEEALQKQIDLKDELIGHKTGGTAGSENAYWHLEYRYSKENGWHRHEWSEAARDQAGAEYGTTAVRQAKERSAVNSTTSESANTYNVGGLFKVSIGIGSTVDHEVSGNKGGEKKETTQRGPLTQAEIDKVYKEAYDKAYADPNRTNVNPNIMCVKDEPKCGSSFSRDIVNEDYKPQGGSKTGDNQSSGSSSSSSSSSSRSRDDKNTPPPPPSKSTGENVPNRDHEKPNVYAGDPSPVTKPGEILASYDQDDLLISPISQCLMEELKEQVSKDMNRTYDPNSPGLTAAQRKKEAEGLLRKGICDAKFFGPLYCQKHKMMKLTTTKAQDLPEEDKTDLFKELQDLGKFNFGNPADYQDTTPIDFNRIPKTDPNTPTFKRIAIPGRG
jgi:hypothetical protein